MPSASSSGAPRPTPAANFRSSHAPETLPNISQLRHHGCWRAQQNTHAIRQSKPRERGFFMNSFATGALAALCLMTGTVVALSQDAAPKQTYTSLMNQGFEIKNILLLPDGRELADAGDRCLGNGVGDPAKRSGHGNLLDHLDRLAITQYRRRYLQPAAVTTLPLRTAHQAARPRMSRVRAHPGYGVVPNSTQTQTGSSSSRACRTSPDADGVRSPAPRDTASARSRRPPARPSAACRR